MKIRLTENAKRKLADTRALGEVALSQNGSERSISLQVPLVNHVPLPLAVEVHAQSRCIGSAHLVIASPTAGGVVGTLSMLERRQTSRVWHESDGTVLLRHKFHPTQHQPVVESTLDCLSDKSQRNVPPSSP